MNPNTDTSEINQLVKRLEAAQTAVKENDKKFITRFRNGTNELLLGSDRTWQRMKLSDWENNLSQDKWLPRVRHAVAILDGGAQMVEVHRDFPFYVEGKKQVDILERSVNDRRIVVVLGPTGTGKTIFARTMVADQPGKRCYVMASPAWREGRKGCKGEGNGPAIAVGLYEKLTGQRLNHVGYEEALSKLTDWLRLNVMTVFIDQAERGGISLMTLLIHLVDETPSRFVYVAYPTHYYRIISATVGSLAETKQFVGRCIKPVFDSYAAGTKLDDVKCLLKHAGIKMPKSDVEEVLKKIVATGGMRTLGDAFDWARRSADEANVEVDAALLLDAIDTVTGMLKVEELQQQEAA